MTGLTNLTTESGMPTSGTDLTQALEALVLSGEWAPGWQLPSERQLADVFGVSRPVVREGLRALRERGLIGVAAGRGSFVREVRPTDGGDPDLFARRGAITARHMVIARTMLEGETAALAARHRSHEDVRRMQRILSAFEHAPTLSDAVNLDVAFHESIAVAAGNPVIQLMFGSIRNLTHGLVLRSLTDRTVRDVGVPLHNVILEAIRDEDSERARAAMVEHIGAAKLHYGPDLDVPLSDVLSRRAEQSPRLGELMHEASESIKHGTPVFASGAPGPSPHRESEQPS